MVQFLFFVINPSKVFILYLKISGMSSSKISKFICTVLLLLQVVTCFYFFMYFVNSTAHHGAEVK